MKIPFHRSYWALPGQLLAGCYPGDRDRSECTAKLQGLVKTGVTLVVTLMEETETDHNGNCFQDYSVELGSLAQAAGQKLRVERFPIRDQSVPTPSHMRSILDAIGDEICAGGVVYVHCWGGKGRTATVIGCHLLEITTLSAEDVLRKLETLTADASESFWPTPQTEEQSAFICSWRDVHD